MSAAAGGPVGLQRLLEVGLDSAVAYLRGVDADAAGQVEVLRRRSLTRASVVVVGETKRGKSSLVNALLGVPGLSPVDVAVSTATYLEFSYAAVPDVRVWLSGQVDAVVARVAELPRWAGVGGPSQDEAPPRRVRVGYPAPLLEFLSIVDTPGAGGLDAAHTTVAVDAAAGADVLLFVVDAAGPLTAPELDFLVEASKRVDVVLFALTKVDAYPGWRGILADNQAALRAYAPRFGAAAWFPVSARLAELALSVGGAEAGELVDACGVPLLQRALVELAGRGHLLRLANLLRVVRGELLRLDTVAVERIRAADPDPDEAQRVRAQRAGMAARRRSESRQWSLALSTETSRARVDVTGLLRGQLQAVQEQFTERIDRAGRGELAVLPREVDRELQAVSVRLSQDLTARFDAVAERALAHVFDAGERARVLGGINATLRHHLTGRPPRGGGADNMMIAVSAGGMAFMAGRSAVAGVSALGAGALLGGSVVVPFAGLGLGLAVGAFMLHRRRVHSDRAQARMWLREVLGEARAAFTDEITHRFTDVQYALTLALDEAIERRLRELDARIADIDAALAQEKATRAGDRAAALARREALRARISQLDELLTRARVLVPAGQVSGG